jgi:hypothetical protein
MATSNEPAGESPDDGANPDNDADDDGPPPIVKGWHTPWWKWVLAGIIGVISEPWPAFLLLLAPLDPFFNTLGPNAMYAAGTQGAGWLLGVALITFVGTVVARVISRIRAF